MTLPSPRPRVILAGARALFVGPPLGLSPHKNTVATLAVALDKPFQLRFLDEAAAKSACSCAIALIPPNRLHHLYAAGDMAFLYLDAQDAASEKLALRGRPDALLVEHLRALRLTPSIEAADFERVLRILDLEPLPHEAGGPLAAIVRRLEHRPQDFRSVAQAARLAGLSASHFQRLFRATTGVPFRRYRLWRRMALVARLPASGATLTQAAIDAGFYSSAHFSAAFRAMFGAKPSVLLALGAEILALDC